MSAMTQSRIPAVLALFAVGGLLLAGCGTSATESERGTERVGAVSRVEVRADTGTVRFSAGPDGSGQVDRELRWSGDEKPQVTQQMSGDVLQVTAICPAGDNACNTDLTITVPAAASVRADVATGNVEVTGLTGEQDLSTGTGNVGGTALGAGSVTAKTTTGTVDIAFAAAPPTVDAEATTGNVTVRLPIGPVYEVAPTTTTGTTKIEVPDTPGAANRVRASSQTGNVSVLAG